MIDETAIVFLLIVVIGFVVSIHRARRAHDREIMDARTRLYKGGLLP